MALEVWKDSEQLGGFILCVLAIPICCIATGLRFAAPKKTAGRENLENWLALASLVFFLVYTLMFLYLLTVLNGRSLVELRRDPETIVHVLKVGWAMSPQFCPNQLLTKLTLLLFYHRIFWVHKGFVRWLWCIGTLTILCTISVYLVKWMLCWPVAYTWNKALAGGKCIKMPVFFAVNESINSVIDFVMIAMAIRIVATLKMGLYEKIRLSILFSVGSLSGIIGFIKIAESYSTAYTSIVDPIWDITQMATSIICCCAPAFPSVFASFKLRQTFSSLFSSLRSWKGTSGANTDQSNGGPWESKDVSQSDLASRQVSASHQTDYQPFDGSGFANTNQGVGQSWVMAGASQPAYASQPTFAAQPGFVWAQVPVVYQGGSQPPHGYELSHTDPVNGTVWVPIIVNQPNLIWVQVPAVSHADGPPSYGYGYDTGSYHLPPNHAVNSNYQ